MHQFGVIKKCLDTVDAVYKHEDYIGLCFTYFQIYLSIFIFQFLLRPRTSKHLVVYQHHSLRNQVFICISILLNRFASPNRGPAQANIYVRKK